MWELDYEESWVQKNWCFWTVVLKKTWESLGLHGDPTSPSSGRSVLGVHWKDQCWSWHSNILATWCKELTHLKRPKCWERLRAGGEGNDREGLMASASQCERLLLNNKTLGFLASGEDKFSLGPEMRLDHSELLCNKVLLKYKGDRESFWHRHQKGAERVHPC